MAQDNRSMMEELYKGTFREIKEGEIVTGTIVGFNDKEAAVDIGFKSEGFVSIEEFRSPKDVTVGTQIDVLVESV
ncbi:MAG: S1 RNA-binding domain-containing protein, partial [Candidatus Omnitrophica bacterium]|nr:S1 RNA-binding domain-containing protein [Candidatus Omnitrophota bacterium]